MIKYLTAVLFIVVFFLCGFTKSLLLPSEYVEAQKIVTQIYGSNNGDPCGFPVVRCKQYNSTYQTINQFFLNVNPSQPLVLNADFSVFSNLTSAIFGERIAPPSNFLKEIENLTLLNSVNIASKFQVLDSDFKFPESLTLIQFSYFSGDFQCKWISQNLVQLYISDADNFTIVGDFSSTKDGSLEYFTLPIPKSPVPYFGDAFPKITTIRYNMKETTYGDTSSLIPSSYFGFSLSSKTLKSLTFFRTDSPNQPTQSFKMPDLSNITNLVYLEISADYFINPDDATIQFPAKQLYIAIVSNINLFKNCINCLKFGQDSILDFNNVIINLESIDFTNVLSINLNAIEPIQKFVGKNLNYQNLNYITIRNTKLYGDLPEELCLLKFNGVSIHANLFNGSIPSCYLCTKPGSNERNVIIPNQFSNFNSSTPFVCENMTFEENLPLYVFDTYGGQVNITGKNLGLSIQSITPTSGYYFAIPNQVFTLYVDGNNGPSNYSVVVTFLNGQNKTIDYTFLGPSIESYSFHNTVFYGTGFDMVNGDNVITINGVSSNTSSDYDDVFPIGGGYLSFDSDPLQGFENGQSFDVYVTSAGQISKTVTFVFIFEEIFILDNIVSKLNSSGSTVTVEGVFYTTNVTGVQVLVGDISCVINKVSNNSLTYTYPGSDKFIGITNLQIIIFGKGIKGQVDITYTTPAPSPTQSETPSPTPSLPTPSETPSESEDVSSSFKLNISFTLILVIFGLSFL